ncbi:MAG: hypothetical protein C4583_14750 [Anaerolineaceae bacterium]|nr:MAG: hypothetical protein C4583_14750 [Anaerolineaceae bacterium]
MSFSLLAAGVVAIVLVGAIWFVLSVNAKRKAADSPSDEKPEYMRKMPPTETVAATKEDKEGITVFDYDYGEKLAAPFAEQIEDILRAKIKADPALRQYEIDFGTGANQSLEIWVNGKMYASVNELPDERLKEAFRSSVKKWNTTQ